MHRKVLAAAVTVGGLTSAAKLAGAAKVIVTARFFGTSDAIDAFLIALLLPSFIADVVAGSFTSSLVPVLIHAEATGGEAAAHRVSRLALAFAVSAMVAAAAGLALGGRWLLPLAGSSFSSQKLQLAAALFFGLLLWLPMSGCIATWRAVLNANRRFAMAAIAPLASPVATIALLYSFASKYGVAVLCAGTVGGVAIECLILGHAVRRLGYPITPAWQGWSSPVLNSVLNNVRRQYLPLVTSAVILSACVLVDQSVAGRLGPGKVSALVYGNKLAAVLLAVIASGVSTAVLPAFSRLAAARDWVRLRHAALLYSGVTTMLVTPVMAILIAGSSLLVRTFFEHGAFQSSAAQLVTQIQRFALLQAPFAMPLAIAVRLTAALSANRLLVWMGGAALIANIILDLVFSRLMGVAGIALASTAASAVSLIVLVMLLRRHQPQLFRAGRSL